MQNQCIVVEVEQEPEQEEEISRLKSFFISMIAHEFRTPLSTILSSADLLEHYSKSWSEEKKMDHIYQIQQAAIEMTELLDSPKFTEQLKKIANQLREKS